jgi:DNA invertase Pin-like site-specific DNA recombinase
MRRIGYRRVSTTDQTTARQLDGVQLDIEFEDKLSGKDTNRPEFKNMMKTLWKGDTLIVHSMDRLNRNLSDLEKTITELIGRGVTVRFVKENLEFTKPEGSEESFEYQTKMLMLRIMGAIGQFERENIKERQREGIAIAKRKGVYLGRKPSLSAVQIAEVQKMAAEGVAKSDIAEKFNVSRPTIYAALNSIEAVFA